MRLQAKTQFTYRGVLLAPADIFHAPDPEALSLIGGDYAVPFNLEDPSRRSVGVLGELIPEVPAVELNPTSASVAPAGGSGSFDVTMTGPGISGTWTAEKDATATWLTINSPTVPQSTDGSVNYSASPNAGSQRTAHIYVNGKTFTITQTGLT